MSVTLDSTTAGAEGLFNRLGRIAKAVDTINVSRDHGTASEWADKVVDVLGYYDAASVEIRETVDGLLPALRDAQSGLDAMQAALVQAAAETVIAMFEADAPLPEQTLDEALAALIRQMKTDGDYVDPNTVAASVTQTSLTGTGVVVVTTKRGDGSINQNLIAETSRIRVEDNTTAGSESLSIRGQHAADDSLAFDWPIGSGGSRTYTSLDAESSANLLTNGGFETFTVANTPDDWTISVGSAGSSVFSEASTVYYGAKALKITGDGSELTQLRQALTTAQLSALTNYAVNLFGRVSAAPSTGVLTVDLFDGTSVINDEAGTANSFTIDLTTIGTSFVAKNGTFRLPDPIPTTVYLRLRLSTALETGKSVFLDQVALQEMFSITADGTTPDVAIFSGATGWAIDDGGDTATNVFTIAVTNDRASQWQTWFERFFAMAARGMQLPYSGSTLINDSLIA